MVFPIQIGVAEIDHVRKTRPAHAPTGNTVGGYMKGERKKEKREKGAGGNSGVVYLLQRILPLFSEGEFTAAAHLAFSFSGCHGR